jgi:putative membrane protein
VSRNASIVLSILVCLGLTGVTLAEARVPWAATSSLHFIDAVVTGDNYRAAAGGLALKKSPSLDVREFGRLLWQASVEDRRLLTGVLTKTEPGVVLPAQLSTHFMFIMDQLVAVSGDSFDRRFIAQQTDSLEDALALAEAYTRFGDDPDLKAFAAMNVPKIKIQLDRILEIKGRHERLTLR